MPAALIPPLNMRVQNAGALELLLFYWTSGYTAGRARQELQLRSLSIALTEEPGWVASTTPGSWAAS